MRILFILVIFLLSSGSSFSQSAPGYMGKRLSVYFTPALGVSLQYDEEKDLVPGINLRNDFSADYAFSKSIAAGFSVKLVKTKLNDAFYYQSYSGFSKAYDGDVRLSGILYSVYIKNFNFNKRGYIAPVGFYSQWEFVYGSVEGSGTSGIAGSDYGYEYESDFEELEFDKTTTWGIIYSFGRQNLFLDKLYINTSASFGFFPGLFYNNSVGQQYNGDEDSYHDNVQHRIAGYMLFNFNVGIGLLAL